MAIVSFTILPLSAVMLLLCAVRIVRTGIGRGFGASFLQVLTQARGVVLSSAVCFGLAMVLDTDLGSAILFQILLSFPIEWLLAVLLLSVSGGCLIKSSERGTFRQSRV